jgi:hypothetical protein
VNDLTGRADVPEYIIDALKDWLDKSEGVDLYADTFPRVHYWVYGDEADNSTGARHVLPERAWVFTFGADHRHPSPDKKHHSLLGYCVQIKAVDETTARSRMISLFDLDWARCYRFMEEATKQGKYTLTDITNELIPEEWRP